MKRFLPLYLVFIVNFVFSQTVLSPSNKILVNFKLSANGQPFYSVNYNNKPVILESALGIKLKDKPALDANFTIETSKIASFNESWKPVLGEQSSIVNHYNELIVSLIQKETKVKMNIIFRVFDEGVAFRYNFPKQAALNYFIISDEVSQFNLTENHKVFWLPGDFDSQEYAYNETSFSDINTQKIDLNNGIGVKSIAGQQVVQSPLMMKSPSGLYLNIFEAAVVNYPIMHLDADVKNYKLTSHLVPNAIGDKAYLQAPCVSPWRTIMISDDARDIVSSKIILNLNEPCKIDDTYFIKPMKYVGIWWEMHVGKSTWDYAGSQNAQNVLTQDLLPSGK
uniref:glycoside hydrolase family 97 N-terminal domain-containing protein n=1 Tax=Flavobacterium sp. TaxID=239 RepID=UPI0037C14F34